MSPDGRKDEKAAPAAPEPESEGPGPSARPEDLANTGDLAALSDDPPQHDEEAEGEAAGT